MKRLFFISIACCIIVAISLPASAQKRSNVSNNAGGNAKGKSFKFIEGIEIKADNVSNTEVVNTGIENKNSIVSKDNKARQTSNSPTIENISSLQFKYAQLLNRNVEEVTNISLYNFIDEWWETRYHYGGTCKKGIDCSAFTSLLMSTVFTVKLPRTAREQYIATEKLNRREMEEGDLVFFNTRGGVSHVGVYLGDGYFVHASRNNGVTISNLEESYYNSHFISGGRVIGNASIAVSSNP